MEQVPNGINVPNGIDVPDINNFIFDADFTTAKTKGSDRLFGQNISKFVVYLIIRADLSDRY